MAHYVEARSPFLDYQFVELAASIPSRMKLKGFRLKHLLRMVAARHVPKTLVERPKQGFSFPVARWLRGDLRRLMVELLRESRFVQTGIFERVTIEQLIEEHLNWEADHNYRLWILINFELRYRLYFEGWAPDALEEYFGSFSVNLAE